MRRTPQGMKKRPGFTLLEVVIVLAIFGVLTALAVFNYTGNLDQYRLDRDARALETHIQEARLRAISENIPVGLVFVRRDSMTIGKNPDAYYLFIDDNGDGTFTPPNTNPQATLDLCDPNDLPCVTTKIIAAGHDRVIRGPLPENNPPGLNRGEYFTRILGDQSVSTGGSPVYVSVVFTPLGATMYNGVVLSGTEKQRSICIQNHSTAGGTANIVQTRGVSLQGPTGLVRLQPLRMMDKDALECIP